MRIMRASSAGFCRGVRMAVDKAIELTGKSGRKVHMLGQIVHNEAVVEKITRAGVVLSESLDAVPEGAVLMIRAHGTPPRTYRAAKEKGLEIIDATCPMVFEIHEKVRALVEEGYSVAVIGDHGHDEVIGISEQAEGAVVVADSGEARALPFVPRRGVVVQSTQAIDKVREIAGILVSKSRELRLFNTICGPTSKRQEEILAMSRDNDVMIVVGSFTSANTCRLTSISKEINPRTYQVQSSAEIDPGWFRGAKSVGLTAGSSTPDWIIDEVVEALEGLSG